MERETWRRERKNGEREGEEGDRERERTERRERGGVGGGRGRTADGLGSGPRRRSAARWRMRAAGSAASDGFLTTAAPHPSAQSPRCRRVGRHGRARRRS
eukprot:scaffold105572_cov26-Tisochrysis_lutea.AAC.4